MNKKKPTADVIQAAMRNVDRFTFVLPTGYRALIETLATRGRCSPGEIVRRALRAYFLERGLDVDGGPPVAKVSAND